MKNYLTEAIGTFFLVLTIGLTVLGGTIFAPLAIGSALMVMVYMGGHISGGHYNPAVSLAVMMRGKLEKKELVPYWVSQIVGAFLAAVVVYLIVGQTFAPAPGDGATALGALLIEFLFTFALCLVVLNSATASGTAGNSFYGLAIGFTVMVGAFSGGDISGGAFNPAVGIGPILMNAMAGDGSFGNLWLYLVGPLLGGAVAAAVFKVQNPDD
jgi:aquaporin Z